MVWLFPIVKPKRLDVRPYPRHDQPQNPKRHGDDVKVYVDRLTLATVTVAGGKANAEVARVRDRTTAANAAVRSFMEPFVGSIKTPVRSVLPGS